MKYLLASLAIAIGLMVAAPQPQSRSAELAKVKVWKNPQCGCCSKWVAHLKAAGFTVEVNETRNMDAVKKLANIPKRLRSCHTAVIGGYRIEGHVAVADIKRLLTERPKILGLAVPAMPIGSAGMEVPSGARDAYNVEAFKADGSSRVFSRHN